VVRVGHTPMVPREQLDAYIIAWRMSRPTCEIVMSEHWIGDLIEGAVEGEFDVGLCRVVEPGPELVASALGERPLRVALAAAHPLAARSTLGLADLAGERILQVAEPGLVETLYHEFSVGLCRAAGFEPTFVPTNVKGPPPLAAVAGSLDVALVDAPPGPLPGHEVIVRALQPAPTMPMHAIIRCGPLAPLVTDFVRIAATVTAREARLRGRSGLCLPAP
jgi:DNA-binding transcriptional LysR family regulator